jgi:tRNA A-37 threonylcarbamoyl transferase component Bud32
MTFIVMQKLEGKPLSQFISNNKLNKKDKRQINSLFGTLHKNNIIHDDIHADNIFVGPDRRFYILDYGHSTNPNNLFQAEKEFLEEKLNSERFMPSFQTMTQMNDIDKLALELLVIHSRTH